MTDDPLRHIPWERWAPEDPAEAKRVALQSMYATRQTPAPPVPLARRSQMAAKPVRKPRMRPDRSGRVDLNAAKAKSSALHYLEGERRHQAHLHRKAQLSARLDAWELRVARRARPKTQTCPTCAGTGNIPGTAVTCPTCAGAGRVPMKRGPIGTAEVGGPSDGPFGSSGGGTRYELRDGSSLAPSLGAGWARLSPWPRRACCAVAPARGRTVAQPCCGRSPGPPGS